MIQEKKLLFVRVYVYVLAVVYDKYLQSNIFYENANIGSGSTWILIVIRMMYRWLMLLLTVKWNIMNNRVIYVKVHMIYRNCIHAAYFHRIHYLRRQNQINHLQVPDMCLIYDVEIFVLTKCDPFSRTICHYFNLKQYNFKLINIGLSNS